MRGSYTWGLTLRYVFFLCFLCLIQIRELTLLMASYINSSHQQKSAAHHLSAPALLLAQCQSGEQHRSKSPPAGSGRPSKAPTLLWCALHWYSLKTWNGLIFKMACNYSREQELGPDLHFAVTFLCWPESVKVWRTIHVLFLFTLHKKGCKNRRYFSCQLCPKMIRDYKAADILTGLHMKSFQRKLCKCWPDIFVILISSWIFWEIEIILEIILELRKKIELHLIFLNTDKVTDRKSITEAHCGGRSGFLWSFEKKIFDSFEKKNKPLQFNAGLAGR